MCVGTSIIRDTLSFFCAKPRIQEGVIQWRFVVHCGSLRHRVLRLLPGNHPRSMSVCCRPLRCEIALIRHHVINHILMLKRKWSRKIELCLISQSLKQILLQ